MADTVAPLTQSRATATVRRVYGEPKPAIACGGRVTREIGWSVGVLAYRDRVTIE